MTESMSKVCVRLPDKVIDYFERKSEETTIGKTTLMRSYLLDSIREKENIENLKSGVEYGGNQNREEK